MFSKLGIKLFDPREAAESGDIFGKEEEAAIVDLIGRYVARILLNQIIKLLT